MRWSLVAACAVVALAQRKEPRFSWYPCPFETEEDSNQANPNATPAECAEVMMPLCYTGVCESDKEITIFVKRLLAKQRPADDQARAMWMVQGGPGFGSPSLEPGLLGAYKAYNGTLSVYTIDHRGTGRSTILTCPPQDSKLDQWQNLAKCHDTLKTQYGGDVTPKGFSVTSAATDIYSVIQSTLFTDNTDIFVYGVSYGTYVVERLMHLAPPRVKGYVLDSVQSEEFSTTKDAPYYSNWDRDVGDTVEQYFSYCDKDEFCSSKLGPSSKKKLEEVYTAMNSTTSACYATISSKATAAGRATPAEYIGSTLYSMLGDKSQWSLIAPFIYRLHRCSQDDANMFANTTTKIMMAIPKRGHYLREEGYSLILYNNIVYSELWELPSPSIAKMTKETTSALFGSKNGNGFVETFKEFCVYRKNDDPACAGYPSYDGGFVYARDAYWGKAAPIPPNSSVLILSGLLDPATPPKYAKDQYEMMKGTEKLLLQFPYGGHGTLSTTPLIDQPNVDCANQIFYQYMKNRGKLATIDTTCIAKVVKLDFNSISNEEVALKIFSSATDVWGPESAPLPPAPTTITTAAPSMTPSKSPSPTPASSSDIPYYSSFLVVLIILNQ